MHARLGPGGVRQRSPRRRSDRGAYVRSSSGGLLGHPGRSRPTASTGIGCACHSESDQGDVVVAVERSIAPVLVDWAREEAILRSVPDTSITAPTRPTSTSARSERRRWHARYARRLAVTDGVALVAAGVAAHLIKLPSIATDVSATLSHRPFIAMTGALALAWSIALGWSGSRDLKTIGHVRLECQRVFQASVSVFGVVAIGFYVFRGTLDPIGSAARLHPDHAAVRPRRAPIVSCHATKAAKSS